MFWTNDVLLSTGCLWFKANKHFINSDSYIPQCYTADREVIGGKARSGKLRCSNASNTPILWISVLHCWKENITYISIDFNNKVITVIVFCFSGMVTKVKKKLNVINTCQNTIYLFYENWDMWHTNILRITLAYNNNVNIIKSGSNWNT